MKSLILALLASLAASPVEVQDVSLTGFDTDGDTLSDAADIEVIGEAADYGELRTLQESPGIDQVTLAQIFAQPLTPLSLLWGV